MSVPEPIEATQLAGRRLGRYFLCYEIASGGMGEVYLAQMRGPAGVERWVALKVLRPEIAALPRFVTMFLDEARIVSRLSHPNLCGVVEFGQADGRYFLALEYLHGETLSKTVRRLHAEKIAAGPPPASRPIDLLVRILIDAARGLHAAHEARGSDGNPLGIVHRDVSPQNLFVLYDGVAKVMDFGIAAARGRESHTMTGEVKGKFAYMSPEQLSGKSVDRRTDVFALGVVLWEAVVGRRLFSADGEGETVLNVMSKDVPRPSSLVRSCPAAVDRVVMRALERDVDRRYQTAAAFAEDLEEFLATLGRPAGPSQVSALMRRLFADRIVERDAMLRAPSLSIGIVPELEFDSGSSIRTASPPARTPGEARPRRHRRWVAASILGAIALAALGLWPTWGGGGPATAGSAATDTRPSAERSGSAGDGAAPSAPSVAPPPRDPVPDPEVSLPAVGAEPTGDPVTSGPGVVRTPRSRPTASGTLDLLTTPTRVAVFLGGRSLGTTPLSQEHLPAGRHTLRLVPGNGGPERRITVVIRPNELTSRSVRLSGLPADRDQNRVSRPAPAPPPAPAPAAPAPDPPRSNRRLSDW